MEVINDSHGKPELYLSGRAQQLFELRGISNTFLSLSHDGDNAVAIVVLETV